MEMISSIARDEDAGADRFRALKMLATQNTSAATLGEILSYDDMLERMTRLLKAVGPDACRVAYRRAFPQRKSHIDDDVRLRTDDVPAEVRAQAMKVWSLRGLYKQFPEAKRNGYPRGYPAGRSSVLKKQWCQEEAIRLILDREQQKVDEAALAERLAITGRTDTEVTDEIPADAVPASDPGQS